MAKATATDWKALTYELAGKLQFAIGNLDCRGTGVVFDTKTGKSETWQRYLAGGLEKVPGFDIDWDAVDALSLSAKQRRNYFAKKRAAAK